MLGGCLKWETVEKGIFKCVIISGLQFKSKGSKWDPLPKWIAQSKAVTTVSCGTVATARGLLWRRRLLPLSMGQSPKPQICTGYFAGVDLKVSVGLEGTTWRSGHSKAPLGLHPPTMAPPLPLKPALSPKALIQLLAVTSKCWVQHHLALGQHWHWLGTGRLQHPVPEVRASAVQAQDWALNELWKRP